MADVSLASTPTTYTSGSIKWSGLASGVDFSSVVDQLVEIERSSITRMETWRAEWEDKIKSITALDTRMVSLKLNAQDMDYFSEFYSKTTTSSNTSVLTTVNTSLAPTGTHSIKVGENIPGQVASTSYDSTAAVGGAVGSTLTIQVGSSTLSLTGVSGAPAVGEFNVDGTLQDLADAILAADDWPNGILENVTVLEDKDRSGTPYQRLVLTAKVPEGGPSEDISVTSDPLI